MLGLVDYGSGSESESESEDKSQPKGVLVNNVKPPAPPAGLGENFFDEDIPLNESSGLNLPSAAGGVQKAAIVEEAELDGAVKPRDWEIQLAEENKKKLEKRAKKKDKKKKHKKDKKEKEQKKEAAVAPKKQIKAKISAFGALATLADDSDSDDEPTPRPSIAAPTTNGSKMALFSMLPAPKTKGKGSGGTLGGSTSGGGLLLPSVMRKKAAPAPTPNVAPAPALKRKADSDDSDGGEDVTDFFGLTSAPEPKQSRLDEVPLMPSTGFGEAIGPSKPPVEEEAVHESQMYNYADDVDTEGPSAGPSRRKGVIDDEMAYNLLCRDETVQITDRRTLNEITAGIIDVSVDQALGPNVNSQLLKGITRAAGSMQMPAALAAKNTADKMARHKHQITYLAQLAVSRDAALQEQWASSRHQKRMGREKYGF